MKNILLFLILTIGFTSCKGIREYVPTTPKVSYINIIGTKVVPESDIRANVFQLKYSYKRIFSSKLYLFLENKRNIRDSLGLKNPTIHFFNNYNPSFDNQFLLDIKNNLSSYYRKNGYLKSDLQIKIDSTLQRDNLYGINIKVNEGQLSVFSKQDSILINNPVLQNLTTKYLQTESLILKNRILNLDVLQKEKEKIALYLKDHGYYYFSSNDLGIYLNDMKDSTLRNVGLVYKIPDAKGIYINKYYDRIFRFDQADYLIKHSINGYQFEPIDLKSKQILSKLLKIQPNDLYSITKLNQGLQNIYLTDQFKSVSIRFDTSSTFLSPHIELLESDKLNFTSEIGGSVFRGIPGPFLTNSLKIRRVASNLDYLDFSVRLGYEAQAGFINTSQTRNNLELNFSSTLNFPELYLHSKISNWIGDYFAPQTQIGLGYDYINRPEYLRTNMKIFQKYNWRKSTNKYFQLSLLDLNLINTSYPNTNISSEFQNYLNELQTKGNNLYRSFNPSFVSSIYFNYNLRNFNYSNSLIEGYTMNVGVESGGTTLNLLPEKKIQFISNLFSSQKDLQFYRFLRLSVDYRKYLLLGYHGTTQFAVKFLTGIAYAYGNENGFQLPYEKNFFMGGPSSLRAWKPRRLGPGANSSSGLIEQPGSMLLETSAELRFKLFKFFGVMNGALFVDAGNVWNFNQSNAPQETVFKLNTFYDQLAVGTGFGLRWDFNYFLLRLDLATKVINPANEVNKKWVLNKTALSVGENPIEFNIGIGYPF
ncbi:MAG: hypothetical protein RI995_2131 [Bacteroidota bacterium]